MNENDSSTVSTSSASDSNSASSPKFAILAGLSALLLAGMAFGASLWILSAVAAGLVIGLNSFLAKTWSTSTSAVRQGGDQEVKIGSRVSIEVSIVNHSKIPVLWLLVEDLLPRWSVVHNPPALKVDGPRIGVVMLWGGETRKRDYQIVCNPVSYTHLTLPTTPYV